MTETTPLDMVRVWSAVLSELELVVSKANFETWIKNTRLVSYEPGLCTIGTNNGFTKGRLETKYLPLLEKAVSSYFKESTKVVCQIVAFPVVDSLPSNGLFSPTLNGNGFPQHVDNIRASTASRPGAALPSQPPLTLNARFSFDTFVVGNNNRLAHAAAVAVAESPGEAYNPLFLYGGVGLGKTHLMHAISQFILGKHPEKTIQYVSSEKFTNELIASIRSNKTEEFRQRYRTVDALLIDDVQFIAGKDSTQEEFFHTFNAIYEAGHQIVLTSDRPPKAIPTLEARLQSRFAAGLIADIQKPDFETRTAILTAKAQERGLNLPQEVIYFIASQISSNIRELEGALTRIVSHCHVHGLPINKEIAANVLSMYTQRSAEKKLSLPHIIDVVCDFYRVEREQITGTSRRKEYVCPRQIAMYLMREKAEASLNQIGSEFGGKDHTTVLHACQKITDLLDLNDDLKKEIGELEQRLGA